MSERDEGPPDDALQALLDAERRWPDEYSARRDAVWQRVEATTELLGASASANPGGATHAGLRAAGSAAARATRPGLVGLASFVAGGLVGGAGGAAIYARLRPTPPAEVRIVTRTVTVAVPAATPVPTPDVPVATAPPDASAQPPAALAPARPRPAVATHAPTTTDVAPTRGTLAAERELIENARAGVARGHPDAALAALERHAQQFPNGDLAEEREGLWIQAQVTAGRYAEARARAARFRRRFPGSMLLPAVDAAIRSIP